MQGYGFEALHYALHGPHSMISSWGGMSPPKDINMVKPIEQKLHSGLFGPWDRPTSKGWTRCRPGEPRWGQRSGVWTPTSSSPTSCC